MITSLKRKSHLWTIFVWISQIFFLYSNDAHSFSSIYQIHYAGLDLSQTNTNSSTIIFLGGFPDTSQTWSPLVPAFQSHYHIVTLALPDYEADSLKSFWGYSIEQMVDGLAQIAQHYKNHGSSVYLVGHDWGAHICLCLIDSYSRMKIVDKVVLLDVGLRSQRDVLMDLTSLSYMSYLAFVFLVSRVSATMATGLARLYPWNIIGPCRHSTDLEYAENNFSNIKGFMTYPYFRVLFSITPQFQSEIPQLFLYGSEKATMFHSEEYLKLLEGTSLSLFRRMENCGHWCHWTKSQEVIKEITSFLGTAIIENNHVTCAYS